MSDKQLEFSFDDPSKPRKKPSRKSSRKSEVLAPTSEGATTYVDFSKTRTPQQKPARRKPATRRGVVAHLTRKGELKLKDVGKRKGYRSIAGGYVAFLVLGVVVVFLGMLVYVKGYQALTRLPKNAVEKVSQLVQPGERLVTVKIESGMSASQVARLLQEQGVVDGADALLAFLQDHDLATKVQKGTYQFRGRPTIEQVAQAITRSAPATLSIIQAGWTLNQVDGYLAQRGYAREGQFLDAAKAVAAEYGLSFTEGWFLSGSYGVSGARTLAEAMHQSAVDAIYQFIDEPPVHRWGVEAVLIVASLVQAETQNVEEMPLIAGIIYNRLEENMPLGIDATTRYELDDWAHQIPQETYERDTPYNTRRKPGLPPSGISCPSLEAVTAACIPLKTEALYYLHGKDGRIHTATDYEGHKKHIERYL